MYSPHNFKIIKAIKKSLTHPEHYKLRIKGKFTLVTDGYKLVMVEEKSSWADWKHKLLTKIRKTHDICIPVEVAEDLGKRKTEEFFLGDEMNDDHLEVRFLEKKESVVEKIPITKEKSLAIENAFPKHREYRIYFGVEHLQQLFNLLKQLKVRHVKLSFYGEKQPMRIDGKTSDTNQRVIILMMPVEPYDD